MKIDFTNYTDEKLKDWIKMYEMLPILKIIYDKDCLYQQAHQELMDRGLTL